MDFFCPDVGMSGLFQTELQKYRNTFPVTCFAFHLSIIIIIAL